MKRLTLSLLCSLVMFALAVPSSAQQAQAGPPSHIVLLLAQEPEAPETDALFAAMHRRFPWARVSPSFVSVERARLRELLNEARRNAPDVEIPDLDRFYRVDDAPSPRAAEALARWLSRSRAVESAYVSTPAIPAWPPAIAGT
jgi:hypothetical protein